MAMRESELMAMDVRPTKGWRVSAGAGAVCQLKAMDEQLRLMSTHISDCPHGLEDLLANGEAAPRLRVRDVHVEHVEHVRDELAEAAVDFLARHPPDVSCSQQS